MKLIVEDKNSKSQMIVSQIENTLYARSKCCMSHTYKRLITKYDGLEIKCFKCDRTLFYTAYKGYLNVATSVNLVEDSDLTIRENLAFWLDVSVGDIELEIDK